MNELLSKVFKRAFNGDIGQAIKTKLSFVMLRHFKIFSCNWNLVFFPSHSTITIFFYFAVLIPKFGCWKFRTDQLWQCQKQTSKNNQTVFGSILWTSKNGVIRRTQTSKRRWWRKMTKKFQRKSSPLAAFWGIKSYHLYIIYSTNPSSSDFLSIAWDLS